MSDRIHFVVDSVEKERFRRAAEAEGKTLSEWLRGLARERVEAQADRPRLDTPEALRRFWRACDVRAEGSEPDWAEHRRRIEASIATGRAET